MSYKIFFNTENEPIRTSSVWSEDRQVLESVLEYHKLANYAETFARSVTAGARHARRFVIPRRAPYKRRKPQRMS